MRSLVVAVSLASLLLVAAPAHAGAVPDPRPPQMKQGPEVRQKLEHVRAQMEELRHKLTELEPQLARLRRATAPPKSERVKELERAIAEVEEELADMRTSRAYTEEHPSVKAAVGELEELRSAHRSALGAAVAPQHPEQRAAMEQSVGMIRGKLERLRAIEQELVSAVEHARPEKGRKPAAPPMARGDGRRRPPGARPHPGPAAGPHPGPHPGPDVEARLQRLERAVKELSVAVRQRGPDRRREPDRERADDRRERPQERDVDVGRLREQLAKLDRMLGAEREEAEGLRRIIRRMKAERGGEGRRGDVDELRRALEAEREEAEGLRGIIEELEQRAKAERERAEELREALRRGKRGESGEQAELRRVVNELEGRVRAEREEAEELRRMVQHLREQRGGPERAEKRGDEPAEDVLELRGHVRGLERRLQVMQHENAELHEVIQELTQKVEALRAERKRK